MGKSTYEKLSEIENDFYDIASYADWCDDDDDGDGYYCNEFVESLQEILDEIVDVLAEFFEEDASYPSTVFDVLSRSANVDDFSELYEYIRGLSLVNQYGVVTGYRGLDFYDMSEKVEKMLGEILCVEWGDEEGENDEG